ncbi:hypothetical protein GBA52_005931 [Prunus armeniaca]|nr:hypothetical protein GBA52_005931 [Prunus armeniaca]
MIYSHFTTLIANKGARSRREIVTGTAASMAVSFPLLKLQEMVAFLLELCINQMATSAPDMVEKRLPESKEEGMLGLLPFTLSNYLPPSNVSSERHKPSISSQKSSSHTMGTTLQLDL